MEIVQRKSSQLKRQHCRKRGTATVEMALVVPLLAVFLFGIIEFGWMMGHVLSLKQAAREGARLATIGATPTAIAQRVRDNATMLDVTNLSIDVQCKPEGAPNHMDFWEPLDVTGSGADAHNTAPPGSDLRVKLTYPHQLITGGIFARLADSPDSRTITLAAAVIMRRE